jgi:pyridoxamine 5'-phosphate oxidase
MSAVDPIAELVSDRERARVAGDPFTDLCVLATADAQGAPGVRTLVLRDVGPQGIGLLVTSLSPKWPALEAGRFECLLVWLAIRRQYRIRGTVAPMDPARVEEYWQHKVRSSKLLDLYYPRIQAQSTVVPSREAFLAAIEALGREHPESDAIPRPEALRGVYLLPRRIEVWRGSPDRLHDRRLFEQVGDGWREAVLVP